MRTLYVITEQENLVKALEGAVKSKKSEIEILGSSIMGEEAKQNINLMQPDFIITDYFEKHIAEELMNLSPQSMVILLSNDMNRSNTTVTQLQEKGYRNISTVDMETVNPINLVEQMLEMDFNAYQDEEDDVFDQAFSETVKEEDVKQIDKEIKTETRYEEPGQEQEQEQDFEKEVLAPNNNSNNSLNVNLSNIRTKTISLFSKKGGTGKTMLAKELANIYSSVKLPKRLANSKEYLTSCVVDLDFESGNVRTTLGIANPSPNIYVWISDILDKIETGADIKKIFFNRFQVMNYVQTTKESNGRNFMLISGQGGIPPRTMQRIMMLDQDGELLERIIKVIIKSVQKVFDVVVLDLESNVSDITIEAMKQSDNIIYVLNNTVCDVENLKVFSDEAKALDLDLNKVSLVINKLVKGVHLNSDMLELLSLIKFEDIDFKTGTKIKKVFPLVADMPYDKEVINITNSYGYITNSTSEVKKGILKICEYCLPIFKIKYTTAGIKELKHLKKINDKKKAKLKMQKEREEKKKAEQAFKKEQKAKGKKKPTENKKPVETKQLETTNLNATEITPKSTYETLEEYLASDLKKVSLEDFKSELVRLGAKQTETGLPVIKNKPKKISYTTWKKYEKELTKDFKIRRKMKKK